MSLELAQSKPRGVLIAGNWKMNHGRMDTENFFAGLRSLISANADFSRVANQLHNRLQACIIPPFIDLVEAKRCALQLPISVSIGAQNAHWEKKGAYTGEISGPMLLELEINWVLVGHSERRQHFSETDKTVRLRTVSLLNQGFKVILCVGETRDERERGLTAEVLTRQVSEVIGDAHSGLLKFMNGQLILAYEPVWAIGTGLTATPEQAEESHQLIRNLIENRMGTDASTQTPILYGGSVTPENIDSLLACPNVDGALVGGASLKPESFFALLQAGAKLFDR